MNELKQENFCSRCIHRNVCKHIELTEQVRKLADNIEVEYPLEVSLLCRALRTDYSIKE